MRASEKKRAAHAQGAGDISRACAPLASFPSTAGYAGPAVARMPL